MADHPVRDQKVKNIREIFQRIHDRKKYVKIAREQNSKKKFLFPDDTNTEDKNSPQHPSKRVIRFRDQLLRIHRRHLESIFRGVRCNLCVPSRQPGLNQAPCILPMSHCLVPCSILSLFVALALHSLSLSSLKGRVTSSATYAQPRAHPAVGARPVSYKRRIKRKISAVVDVELINQTTPQQRNR